MKLTDLYEILDRTEDQMVMHEIDDFGVREFIREFMLQIRNEIRKTMEYTDES